jgi:peptide/nickel transport system permease protein
MTAVDLDVLDSSGVLAPELQLGDEPEGRPRDPTRRSSRRALLVLARPGLILSWLIFLLAVAWAIWPQLFTHYDPIVGVPADKLTGPSLKHWFGTDYTGRDLYTRVVFGARRSLETALLAVGIALGVGSVFGLASGFFGGFVDAVLMRVVDVVLSIPSLLLSLLFITGMGFGTVQVATAVGLGSFAAFARVMRADVLRTRATSYAEAARVSGTSPVRVLLRHVLPNSLNSVLALAALEFAHATLAIAALSFLGFGAPPPQPEWGSLIAEGRDYIASSWWLIFFPGAVVALVVASVNRVARVLKF